MPGPKALVATVTSGDRLGVRERTASVISMSAGRYKPTRRKKLSSSGPPPAANAIRAAPMLDEYSKISGTDSQRFLAWSSPIR